MVNGAGLAMATMDLIKYAGFEPANLDVGGTDAKRVETVPYYLKRSKRKSDVIFEELFVVTVARELLTLTKIWEITVPIIVRLQGTNAAIAKELIDNSGMPILSAVEFQEAADQVKGLFQKIIRYKNPVAMANRIFV
jgi:succinyl-CoA synthetase beta subunit